MSSFSSKEGSCVNTVGLNAVLWDKLYNVIRMYYALSFLF